MSTPSDVREFEAFRVRTDTKSYDPTKPGPGCQKNSPDVRSRNDPAGSAASSLPLTRYPSNPSASPDTPGPIVTRTRPSSSVFTRGAAPSVSISTMAVRAFVSQPFCAYAARLVAGTASSADTG